MSLHPTYDHGLDEKLPVCRLGAATQERNPTTAPQNRRPKLVGLRCRSTRPTTTLCRVALPLHPTYDYGLDENCQFVGWVQRRRSETQRQLHKPDSQSLSGCAAAPPNLRPCSVGLRCCSTRPTTTLCRVALPLHPTYGHVLSGCAAAPPDLRPRSVGLRCRSTRPTTCKFRSRARGI